MILVSTDVDLSHVEKAQLTMIAPGVAPLKKLTPDWWPGQNKAYKREGARMTWYA